MISEAWEEYAAEHNLDKDDAALHKLFEWAWHTAVNECEGYLMSMGQIGLGNMLQDYMRDGNWEYEEDDEEQT